jgi:outer membrane protein TolC
MVPVFLTTMLLAGAAPCGPLGLDEALALALERSDEVAIKQAELASAKVDQALASALRVLPSASATVVTGPSPEAHGDITRSEATNRSLSGLRPFGRVDVQLLQPLYTFGRLDAASEAAQAGVVAREQLVQDTQAQVQLRVVQLYWGTALARRFLSLAGEVEKALDEADKRLKEALATNEVDVSPSDKYRLDLFRGIVRGREAEAQKGLELARIGLAATIGIGEKRLELKQEELQPSEGDLPDAAAVVAAAERQRPDLRALGEAIKAREAEVKAARGAMLPQFFVAGQFSYAYAPNRDIQLNPWVHDDFNLLAIGGVIGFKQDLAFPTLSARAEKARAEQETLLTQRAGLVRLVEVQVESGVAEVKAARERFLAARASLGSGKSLFRSVGLDFTAGLTDAKTLIDAYALYVESQVQAAQAAYDLVLARARLAQVAGEPPVKGNRCELR